MEINHILVGINKNLMSVLCQLTIYNPTQWVVKWPGREPDHSLSFDDEIKTL
jgi:hypothetical protein